ncbi:hypothetical protein LCGC14_1235230 [marine sediment metagenome]|uniref:Uncharacterized protein n=1 Tax=marine sediment metagenome TaxID=412755 RepID=A0A0F9LBM3_9ZZZZ
MEHLIRFPVGDWSDDGHGKCHYFIVRSNKPVQELRELHFSCKEKLGFDIGDICRDYEDSELSLDIFDKLQAAGFDIEWNSDPDDDEANTKYSRYFAEMKELTMDPEEVFNLWTDILKFLDPDLNLELTVVESDDINFYGFDEKKRHLNTPGYGVFY